jgi:hypothetical protein
MLWRNHVAERLFRIASSQKNVDRVAMWHSGTAACCDAFESLSLFRWSYTEIFILGELYASVTY